jgi:hypothetical protein
VFSSLGSGPRYLAGLGPVVSALLAAMLLGGIASAGTPSTPVATPAASPVASDGCNGLEAYFMAVAALADANEGLAVMQEVGHDVLKLDSDEVALVVTELDALIASIGEIDAPEPARAWQAAYLDLLRWYRNMAASRDPIALQRIVNDDRRLFVNLATAVLSGQMACPGTWDPAWDAAFGE